MKKIFSFIFLSFVLIQLSYTQDLKKGKEILTKVSKKYAGFKSIKADFKYMIEIPQEKFKDMQTGTAFLKGSKFKLEMKEQNIMCDGKKVYTYLKDDNSVQITNYDPKILGFNPSEIFTMHDKNYTAAYLGMEGIYQLIELTPIDKKKSVFKIKMYLDKNNNIVKSKAFEKNGNIYTYEVSNFNGSANLLDAVFTFDKAQYPKVIVNDLTK